MTTSPAFEVTSKRRKSYPSETAVKRGYRVVHGGVELLEKLGRNDPCPCGSGRRFQALLSQIQALRWLPKGRLLLGTKSKVAPDRRRGLRESALPPKADILRSGIDVCFVPCVDGSVLARVF